VAQARRVRILEAARERFIEHGLGGATTRDIARAADVPESSMFRHFSSKGELFEESIAAHLGEILRSARKDDVAVLTDAPSESARLASLEAIHRHYLEVMEQALPVLGAAMFSERTVGREIYRARVHPLLAEMGQESVRAMAGWANERADGHTMIFLAFGGYLVLSLDSYFGGSPIDHGATAERVAWLIQYGVRGRPSAPLSSGSRTVTPAASGPASPTGPAQSSPARVSPSRPPVRGGRIRRERSDAIANRARLLDAAREEIFARGFGGATTREIAKAAGTTESALYRHFSSKEQLFHAAVGDRLQEIINAGLAAAETELAHLSTDDQRLDVFRGQHLHYLKVIEQTAPLLGAALFSEREAGTQLYRSIVAPFLDRMTEATREAMIPWANDRADARTLILVAVGGYLLISLDAYFRETTIDHEAVADRIAWLLYYGVAGRA
jgi:AcrR family transcriptional regulator